MTLGQKISEARKAIGKSQQDVASHFDIKRSAVSQWEKGITKPRIHRLGILAKFLGVDLDWLLHGDSNNLSQIKTFDSNQESAVKLPQPPVNLPSLEEMPRDVPVLGTARGGLKGSFVLNDGEPIDWVRRPPGIMKAKDVYSIYVEGDSMSPRFMPGELVYAHPHKKVNVGNYVIVQQKIRDGHVEAFIKKLKRRTASKVILEQTNPPATIEMPEKTIVSMHLILTMNDLMGV